MYRLLATCLALCLMIVITGCKASSESQDATTAVGGMMPTGEASPEILYAVDQAEVKVLAERTISKEPLSTFRDKLEEKRAAEAASMAKTTTDPAGAGDATTTAAPEEKSVWGSVRSLFGGKKAATGDSAAKSDATTDDDMDTAKAEDDGESAEKNEDAGDDEDW